MANKPNKRPGEEAAIGGYGFQYSIFATEIYNALLNEQNDIEWIEFASHKVGKLDDVLIGLKNTILAFQVKNINTSTFSFSGFINSDTQSIFEGMVEGWKKLKRENQHKALDIRFITTQSVSKNDKIDIYSGPTKPSFHEFINNFWEPIKSGRYIIDNIPKVWIPVFNELKLVAHCNDTELISFIRDTSFVFDYAVPKLYDAYVEQQRRLDIEEISKQIFQTISQNGSCRYSKSKFLKEFRLTERYESYFVHSFFVDESHYQPINETIQQLEEAIKKNNKGYIALVGNAGSGKSTLLTKWLQQANYKVLKYYAYVSKEMSYESGYRGEARTFLHDILVQMRQNSGFLQSRLPTTDFIDLQKQFSNELVRLSREQEKVIIVVDGLDHIVREQQVDKSLIAVLSFPENIPDNVYFILGSRTIENLDNLNARIREELKINNRTINIKPLDKNKIQNILTSHQIELSEHLLEELYINTKGHPLFLRYTVEEIKKKSESDLGEIISQRKFNGDIYLEYQIFWDKYKDEDDFVEVLGLISRLRHSYFDISLLNGFPRISREHQRKIKAISEHYFYKNGSVWQFFHNSFKEFLIKETATDILTNIYNSETDAAFHQKIYESTKEAQSEYKWNGIYHLNKAAKYSSIISIASQEYFRQQWFEFRSYKLIKEDLSLTINASNKEKDIYCLFRCFLSLFEIKQRYNNFTPSRHIDTFLQLNQLPLANSFVYDNVELLISPTAALQYSIKLYKMGYKELAFDIFERASPSYILHHSKSVNERRYHRETYQEIDEIALVGLWAKAASLFTPIETILERVSELTVEKQDYHQDETRDPVEEALSEIQDIGIELKNWENLRKLEKIFLDRYGLGDLFYFYYKNVSQLSDEDGFYGHCLEILNRWNITDSNPINRRLLKTQLLIRKDIDKAKPMWKCLLPPSEVKGHSPGLRDDGFLDYIFDYSTFFYIITENFAVPSSSFTPIDKKHTVTAFYNAFADLGKSHAYIYLGHKDASIEFYLRIEQFLGLFHYRHNEYGFEYSISESKPTLINLILKISSNLSVPIFAEVLERISKEWTDYKKFWNTSHIQEVIEWVINSKLNTEWCKTQLEAIDSYAFTVGNLEDRIDRNIVQIKLWSKLGFIEKGEAILTELMRISLDVRAEKDYQLDRLVKWIKCFDTDMSSEIMFYLQHFTAIHSKAQSALSTPSREILELSLNYGNGLEIFRHLLFNGYVKFNDGLELVLSYLLKSNPQNKGILTKLFTRIVVAYDAAPGARNSFLEKLLTKSIHLSKKDLFDLVNEIFVFAISQYKNEYLFEIQEFAEENDFDLREIGLSERVEKSQRNGSDLETEMLTFEDGSKITAEELIGKLSSLQQLKSVQNNSDYYSNFAWEQIYKKIFKASSDDELLEFINTSKVKSRNLATMGKVLIEAGRNDIATTVLYRAIQEGEKHGWVKFYDGGSKIAPFELLNTIAERSTFKNVALDDFSNSMASFDFQTLESLLDDVPKIWNFFSENTDLSNLYSELKDYRSELFSNYTIDQSIPSVNGDLTNEDLLVEILFFLLTFPSDFNYAIQEILLEEIANASVIIKKLLNKLFKNEFFFKYVELIKILSFKNQEIICQNEKKIGVLVNNRRYDTARIAYHLLEEIDISPQKYIIRENISLPLIYQLEIEYTPSIFNSDDLQLDHIDKNGFLKDTDDPLVYVRLYLHEIGILSMATDIPVVNLARRIMVLGVDLEFPDWCKFISEEKIRSIYSDKFDLEISYKRPRVQLVWDGLMKVIKELLELNLIEQGMADLLSLKFDEKIHLIKAFPKPKFVLSILNKSGRAPSTEKNWAKEITKDYLKTTLSINDLEGAYILGEHSIIDGMGWGQLSEIRQAFIETTPKVEPGEDRGLIFNSTHCCRIDDYLNISDMGILLHNKVLSMKKKQNWLAINPNLCNEMGLIYNFDMGNFRWDDENGNTIIESIYWQTNSVDNRNKHHDSEAGCGWYVVLYKNGHEKFKSIIENYNLELYHHKKISRHVRYISERHNEDINSNFSVYESSKVVW